MWKFQDFSVIQILREINFKESRCSKTAVVAIFWALNFDALGNIISPQKIQKFINSNDFSASKFVQSADFALLEYQKLISRKI